MNQTLHKKLTDKNSYSHTAFFENGNGTDMLSTLRQEMKILQHAAKELLQPRQEAVLQILAKSKNI